jgi:hypothetical protein
VNRLASLAKNEIVISCGPNQYPGLVSEQNNPGLIAPNYFSFCGRVIFVTTRMSGLRWPLTMALSSMYFES